MGLELVKEILDEAYEGTINLTHDQRHALENMQTCRTVERGGRVLKCPECKIMIVSYNPCNQRGCPQCSEARQIQWKQGLQGRLAPVSHYHVVFSIPKIYTDIWLWRKKALIGALFRSVSIAIKTYEEEIGLQMGSVLVFQSHGKGMSYKPHIHCILTAGGLDKEGKWKSLGSLSTKTLEKEVKANLNKELTKHNDGEEIVIDDTAIYEKEWSVFGTYHKDTGKGIAGYLSHSIAGAVIDFEREYTRNEEMIAITERHLGDEIKTCMSKKTFIERYLNHIPPSGAVMIRYYGLYSNKQKAAIKSIAEAMGIDEGESIPEYIEECPVCHKPMTVHILLAPMTAYEFQMCLKYPHDPPKHREVLEAS
jgi:hypothetical protein